MQAVTDIGQLSRSEFNALLLDFRALVLAVSALLLPVSALANLREIVCHLLHGPSELSKLAGDARYVRFDCHVLPGS